MKLIIKIAGVCVFIAIYCIAISAGNLSHTTFTSSDVASHFDQSNHDVFSEHYVHTLQGVGSEEHTDNQNLLKLKKSSVGNNFASVSVDFPVFDELSHSKPNSISVQLKRRKSDLIFPFHSFW